MRNLKRIVIQLKIQTQTHKTIMSYLDQLRIYTYIELTSSQINFWR